MQIKAELLFPSKLKDEPLICNICKQFDIILNIVEASFSTDTGWAILIFKGSEVEVNRTLEYLKNKDVEIKDVQKDKT
jgi:ABC-type methionine transport system ATPase subunit